jgi:CubicO group peptidase (beta-lactamase class C family)
MKTSRLLSAIILLLMSCQQLPQKSNQKEFETENPDFATQFETELKKIYKENELFGDFIFAVVDENGLAYSFALNKDILEGRISSLDDNSPIYIASHTKSFMGTLLKILEEKDQLDLNRSLADYLPELNFNDSIDTKSINIRALLNHTHGTFSNSLTWKTAFLGYSGDNAELINDLNTDFLYDPSGRFRYSNVGPILACFVVEKQTGNTWKEQMKEQIFDPLRMKNTSANVTDFDLQAIRPSVTASKDKGIIETGFYKEDVTMHASGGIISTINDLSKWLSANIRQDEKLMNKDAWADLHNSSTVQDREYFTYKRSGYSLGWDVAEYQNEEILTRFGGLAGISFHISFMPEKDIGIIALSTDNRAFALPHLMANYAYNQLNDLNADSIFIGEKQRFNESFSRENDISYPNKADLLENGDVEKEIVGDYKSTSGWPAISINNEDSLYIFNWGVLSGKIYKTENGSFLSRMGVLDRNFEIKNDTLITGSLIYTKIKE